MSNVIQVIGNVGSDPRETDWGCSFSLADNHPFKEGRTTWYSCSINFRADVFMQYIKKGQPIWISGRLESQEKNEKTYLNIAVDRWEFVNFGKKEEGAKKAMSDDDFNAKHGIAHPATLPTSPDPQVDFPTMIYPSKVDRGGRNMLLLWWDAL